MYQIEKGSECKFQRKDEKIRPECLSRADRCAQIAESGILYIYIAACVHISVHMAAGDITACVYITGDIAAADVASGIHISANIATADVRTCIHVTVNAAAVHAAACIHVAMYAAAVYAATCVHITADASAIHVAAGVHISLHLLAADGDGAVDLQCGALVDKQKFFVRVDSMLK